MDEATVGWDDPRWADAGITYRQLDYWTRNGYMVVSAETPGSGVARRWPETEIAVAAMVRRLIDAGVTMPAAHRLARDPYARAELAGMLTGVEVMA